MTAGEGISTCRIPFASDRVVWPKYPVVLLGISLPMGYM